MVTKLVRTIVVLLMVSAVGSRASAQDPAAQARVHFERGVGHAQAGQWDDALVAFRASLELVDRGRTVFNVAVALDRLERGPECVQTIDALLARDDVDAGDREEAETLRRRWATRLGTLVLRVQPASAVISVDGQPTSGEGTTRRLLLTAGTHRVLANAPGHVPSESEIRLIAGGEVRLELALEVGVLGGMVGSSVQLRPLDRATVRIVALRGAEAVRPRARDGVGTVVPRAAHGSGLLVHPDGWILTARHVVEGADRLVVLLPGETRAVAARTVWRDPEHDLAFVRIAGGPHDAVALGESPGLVLGQAVDASGYPLDPTERWPNASAGQVGRPLNDGRVQLSMALNPGNSGGPVAVDGHPIGVVSQGGDPGRGVQGVVVMEPVAPAVTELARLLATPMQVPVHDAADDLLVTLIGAAQPPPVVRRVARLREVASNPPADARGALWALEAEDVRRTILRDAQTHSPSALPPDLREVFDEATSLASTITAGFIEQPELSMRYEPLRALTSSVRRVEWECAPGTVCTQEIEPREPGVGWLFDLTVSGGIAVDDDQRSSFVEGAMWSALGLFHLGNIGRLDPLRFNVVLGMEASIGTWRGQVGFSWLADVGVRLAVGNPAHALSFQLLYTPGPVAVENRWDISYLAYRATVAFQLEDFGVGLSWRELGRGAADTQRSLELLLSWGI